VWRCALVAAPTRSHLTHFIAEYRSPAPVLVWLAVDLVAAWPAGYNALCAMAHATVLVAIPLLTLAEGSPSYSRKSKVLVIALPSCRLAGGGAFDTACRVYQQAERGLHATLASLDHMQALCWRVGATTSVVTFPGAAVNTAAQQALEQAFWWVPPLWRSPGAVPADPFGVLSAACAMVDARRLSATQFTCVMMDEPADPARVVAHFLLDTGEVVPFWGAVDPRCDAGGRRVVTCTFTEKRVQDPRPLATRVWKTAAGGLTTPAPPPPPLEFV